MNKYQQMAYNILCQISTGQDEIDKINHAASKLFDPDFPPSIALMPNKLQTQVVALIGEILEPNAGDHNIAAYWLWEAKGRKGGGKIIAGGRTFKIRNLEDVKEYIEGLSQ